MPFNQDISDQMIQDYTAEHPERGERMITAMMLAKSKMIYTRQQIRESIARVDRDGLLRRKNQVKYELRLTVCKSSFYVTKRY